MEEFREQTPINTPDQPLKETEGNEGKEKVDQMMPFLEGEAQMYNNASAAIEGQTNEPEKEGRMRRIRKAIAGGVGLTLLAGSIAMGVPSAYGGEHSRGKTPTEHIEKTPQKENIEKKETKEDEKNPLYMAGVEMAKVMYLYKNKNENGKPSLSADQLNMYLKISPIYLKGFLDSWKKFDAQYEDQKAWEESFEKSKEEGQKDWTTKRVKP